MPQNQERLDPSDLLPPPPRRWTIALCAFILLLYLSGVSWRWWPTKDSALYLSLARSLARGDGYTVNGQVNTMVTPGLPGLVAGLWMVFGEHVYVAGMAMTVCGLTAMWLNYRVARRLESPAVALAALAVTALSFKAFRHSGLVLTEAPAAALVAGVLAIWYLARGWPVSLSAAAMAVLAAATVTVRVPLVALLAIFALGFLMERNLPLRRRAWCAAGVLVGALAPTAFFYWLSGAMSQQTPLYLKVLVEEPLAGPTFADRLSGMTVGMVWGLPNVLTEMFTGQDGRIVTIVVGYPLAVLLAVGMVWQWRRGLRVLPLAVVLFALVSGLSLGAWAVKVRYLIPLHLVMMLLVLQGLVLAVRRLRPSITPRRAAQVLAAAAVLGIAINSPRLGHRWFHGAVLSYTDRFYATAESGRHCDLPPLAALLRSIDGRPAAASPRDLVTIQYFTDLRLEVTPTDMDTADDAKRQAEWVAQSDCELVIFGREAPREFFTRLDELLRSTGRGYEPAQRMRSYRVWRARPGPK